MATVLNYTPHDPLRVFVGDDQVAALPAAGDPVRLHETAERIGALEVGGRAIPVVAMAYGSSEGLPQPQPGVVLVVSQLVCRAYPKREDLVFPIDLVRDERGDVRGCRGFARGGV